MLFKKIVSIFLISAFAYMPTTLSMKMFKQWRPFVNINRKIVGKVHSLLKKSKSVIISNPEGLLETFVHKQKNPTIDKIAKHIIKKGCHKKLSKAYEKETLNNLKYDYSQEKIGKLDFRGKIRKNVYTKISKKINNELLNIGIPIEKATPKDIKNLIFKLVKNPEISEYSKKISKRLHKENFYKKMMECLKYGGHKCKQENTKLLENIISEYFEEYYQAEKGKILAVKNYLKKKIPTEIGIAGIFSGHPDNLKKFESEI